MTIPVLVAVGASIVVPMAALGGPVAAATVAVLAAGAAAVVLVVTAAEPAPLRVLLAALGPAVAGMALVLARAQGLNLALFLVAAVCLFDMACFVMGNGRGAFGGWFGLLAGVVSVGILAVFAAGVMVPPFSGDRPWVVFGVVAVLAPAGVLLAGRVAPGHRLPAVRRLDSLFLAGLGWVAAVSLLLHR